MLIFLTVYLGLIAGRQPFELRADPAIASIRLMLDGSEVATLTQPPWKTTVDLGPALVPRELIAVGLDASGHEIARASQVLNLPWPQAEVQMIVRKNAAGAPAEVELEGRHLTWFQPSRSGVQLDGVALPLDRHFHASVPAVDMKRPHVISAEMAFSDGTVARREFVFGGEFGETVPTELTPVAVRGSGSADACFVSNGTPLRVSSVEKSPAMLFVVRDPDPAETRRSLKLSMILGHQTAVDVRRAAHVDATMELVSPVGKRFTGDNHPTTMIFPRLQNRNPDNGLYAFAAFGHASPDTYGGPRRWASAVAAAAVQAVGDGRRRAVILMLGSAPDASEYSPAGVRKFLDTIGVPLFVWSVKGPVASAWGEVEDVSTKEKFERAAAEVSRALDEQRIAWVYADPWTALHTQVSAACGYTPLAQP